MKEQKMLIDLSKKLISDETSKLNNEISKLNIHLSVSDKNELMINIETIIAQLIVEFHN